MPVTLQERQLRDQNARADRELPQALILEEEEQDPDPQPNRLRYQRPAEWHPDKPGEPPL